MRYEFPTWRLRQFFSMGYAQKVEQQLIYWRNRYGVRLSIRHVSGPRHITLKPFEVAVVLLGRNVEFFLPKFYEHHIDLGAHWLIYLDNDSTDASIDLAAGLPNTIVAKTSATFRTQQKHMRYWAASLFASGGWRLALDADELFDYPGADRLPLPDLVRRLEGRGHTGVVGQMLDMVPIGPRPPSISQCYENAIRECRGFSLSEISTFDYYAPEIPFSWFLRQNRLTSCDVKVLFGGIRRELFDEDCCLSKHPLFRPGKGVVPLPHPHVTTGLVISDFTALLRHYKFSGDFVKRERKLIAESRLSHDEAKLRAIAFQDDPRLRFDVPTMRRNPTTEQLMSSGFLVASAEARSMLGI